MLSTKQWCRAHETIFGVHEDIRKRRPDINNLDQTTGGDHVAARFALPRALPGTGGRIPQVQLGMTEPDLDKLLNVVPVGEANAAAASTIWKQLDMYARSTVQHQLSWLADAGRICRTSRCMPMGGEVRLYYRMQHE